MSSLTLPKQRVIPGMTPSLLGKAPRGPPGCSLLQCVNVTGFWKNNPCSGSYPSQGLLPPSAAAKSTKGQTTDLEPLLSGLT